MNRYFNRLAELTALNPARPTGKPDSSPGKSGEMQIEQDQPEPLHREVTKIVEPAKSLESSFGKPLEHEPASQETAREMIPTDEQTSESSTADSEREVVAKHGPAVQSDYSASGFEITERVEIVDEKTSRTPDDKKSADEDSPPMEKAKPVVADIPLTGEDSRQDRPLRQEIREGKPPAGDLPETPQSLEQHVLEIPAEGEIGIGRNDYHSAAIFKRRRDRTAMIRTALNWLAEDPNLEDFGKRTTPEIGRESVEIRSAAESTVRDGEKPTSVPRRAIEIDEHIEREAEDFNISIGSISLTVEEPKKETKIVQPPPRPVVRHGPPDISTRLSRHYIKVR